MITNNNNNNNIIKSKKYSFGELTTKEQKKLLELRTASFTLKSITNPEQQAIDYFKHRRLSKRGWRYLKFVLFQRIDVYRIKLGLKPIHNVL